MRMMLQSASTSIHHPGLLKCGGMSPIAASERTSILDVVSKWMATVIKARREFQSSWFLIAKFHHIEKSELIPLNTPDAN